MIDVLMRSLSARQRTADELHYDIEISGASGRLSVSSRDARATGLDDEVPLVVGGPCNLPSEISYVDVTTDSEVIVSGRLLRLGPMVNISADSIVLSGDECVIDASGSVTLRAPIIDAPWGQELDLRGQEPRIESDLAEGWPSRFSTELSRESVPDADEYLFTAFRSILQFFSRTQRTPAGELTANQQQLSTRVLSGNRVADAIVDHLLAARVMRMEGKQYRLPTSFLSDMGISYRDVKDGRSSRKLKAFLSGATHPGPSGTPGTTTA